MKHDHKKTKKLKVALFSIVMLLPCLAVGITCLTHVFNEKVTEETETATINYMYETNQLEQDQLFTDGNIYKIYVETRSIQIDDYIKNFYIHTIYGYNNTENKYTTILDDTQKVFWLKPAYPDIEIYDYDDNYILSITDSQTENTDTELYIVYDQELAQQEGGNIANQFNVVFEVEQEKIPIKGVTITTNPQDQTTNIFYDSCTQVQQSFILNWCDANNPISQPIIGFTNVFSLPNDHIINTLLTYWFSISMIYIVIDIIIECIVYITHFFNKEQ